MNINNRTKTVAGLCDQFREVLLAAGYDPDEVFTKATATQVALTQEASDGAAAAATRHNNASTTFEDGLKALQAARKTEQDAAAEMRREAAGKFQRATLLKSGLANLGAASTTPAQS